MIKSTFRSLIALLLGSVLMSVPGIAAAGGSLESEIELLRSDIKTEKVEIVTAALDVEGAKADAFWPVYRKYQADLDKIGDKRIALIKDYAANFTKMTDAKAKTLVKQALDLQSQRTNLLKSYYPQFEKVLGSIDAAKLVQVENLILALLDVQVGAELPLIEKSVAAQ
jgi:hypothetical protein